MDQHGRNVQHGPISNRAVTIKQRRVGRHPKGEQVNELPRPVVQEPWVDVLIVASLGRCHVVLEPQPTIDEVPKVRGVVRKVVLFKQMNEVLEVKLDSVVLQNERKKAFKNVFSATDQPRTCKSFHG